ncbi:DNA-binding transcriptional LysR family regulator [Oceanisphaera litoralis]|uniref:LysR family transcriptional regulator n=1 Tax=Oceanisphaera litoralis TaxID=225144 RepID=UPI001958724B|nr:LysR family transcriptional regulator [Oceanisphaera litoralis]MBM7456815.1 DNA-binding transcriptional LysR family regulator [Oceanisphaera litoralis]
MSNIVPLPEQLSADDLLIFAQVAQLHSFTQAANRLGRPKSTVSRRITVLEEQLGERLFVRTTRRMTLTEFGEQLLDHAQQVTVEVQAAWALSEQRKVLPSGRLRVSIPSDFANLFLVDMLAAFVALHPEVSLELDLSARRVDLLGEGFDLAVRMGALPDDALLTARRLTVFSSGLYAAPEYLLRQGEPQQPDDLQQHQAVRLLTRTGEPARWHLCNGAKQWQGVPLGRLSANSPVLLMRLACTGAGIVEIPHQFALTSVQAGHLRPVLSDWSAPEHIAWVVFPGRRLMPAKTRAFIDMLHAALNE